MSVRIMSAVWQLAGLSPPQKLVFLSLADQSNDDGLCYPSAITTANRTGLSESSTRRAIAELEKLGHLSRKYQTGKSTFYTLHPCQSDTPVRVTPLSERQGLEPRPLSEKQMTPVREANITISESKIKDKDIKIGSPSAHTSQSGTRLPADWKLPDEWISDATAIGVEHYQVFLESEKFRDYWHSVAGAKGRKADWRATWRNWVRRSQENSQRNLSHAERKHAFAEHKARRDFSRATTETF